MSEGVNRDQLYYVVEATKENGVNPLSYLTYLFQELPNQNLDDLPTLTQCSPRPSALKRKVGAI